jgi:PKD repeat protein
MKTVFLAIILLFGTVVTGTAQVLSDFETGTTDGWVSEGDGVYFWEGGTGHPGGCLRVNDDATGDMNRSYAPVKFLGNWSAATAFDTLKADIFLHRISTTYVTTNYVFRIIGPGGQATGILNPKPISDTWTTYMISLSASDWQLNSGTWSELLQNVTTLIVTMEYITGDEYNRLDNVSLSFTPVRQPVVPVICSGFEDGTYEGWTFLGTGGVSNQASGGNPGRYIQAANGSSTAYAYAPSKFQGDWNLLDNHAADINFDLIITTAGTLLLNDAFLRISGPGGVARIPMNGNVQNAFGKWYSFTFPVAEVAWTMESGAWDPLIDQVTELRLCLEFSSSSETVGLDNFCISNLPPQAAFSADYTYSFVGNPIHFTDQSAGVPTSWDWDFGDSNVSSEQNPVHTYNQTGLFDVTLTVTNSFGSDTEQKVNYIEVAAVDGCMKYADNFNSPAIHPAWRIHNGTWAVSSNTMMQSGNYSGTSYIDGCYAITGSPLWSDYFISAGLRSTDDDAIGLVFNVQDYQNMYMFLWRKQTSERTLYKWINGVATVLASDNIPYISNTWYQVKAGGYHGNIFLTIDGAEIFHVQDNTFTAGTAGMYCWGNSSSYWDNLLIECAIVDSTTIENVTVPDLGSECYEATQVITAGGGGSTFLVATGGTARLVAGQKIGLLPGVLVQPGGNLHAWISTDGYFCSEPAVKMTNSEEESLTVSQAAKTIDENAFTTVYPNPTTGIFYLDMTDVLSQDPVSIEIYDMLGNRVMKTNLPAEKSHAFDLSGQVDGIYILKVLRDNEVMVVKIVKQR